MSQCIQHFHLNHKILWSPSCGGTRPPFHWSGDTLTARFDTDVVVEFEQVGENYRIKNLKAAAPLKAGGGPIFCLANPGGK